eukprot:694666-Pleurochrysis_carterae.AAC.3
MPRPAQSIEAPCACGIGVSTANSPRATLSASGSSGRSASISQTCANQSAASLVPKRLHALDVQWHMYATTQTNRPAVGGLQGKSRGARIETTARDEYKHRTDTLSHYKL